MTYGPDPSTHARCTVGGMVGNNACGSHSVAWGTAAQNLVAVTVMLADGREVLERAEIPDGVAVSVLVPNERGLEAALEVRDRIDEVTLQDGDEVQIGKYRLVFFASHAGQGV